jgi:hypothetical protein
MMYLDLVIHVDHRMITADRLTTQLLTSFPAEFEGVSQFERIIPRIQTSPTRSCRFVRGPGSV